MKSLIGVCLAVLLLATVAQGMAFGVIGDWGLGGMASFMSTGGAEGEMGGARSFNKLCQKLGCNFTLSCGDNIYVGNVMQGLHDSFESMYGPQTGPFFPSVGNHDNAGPQIAFAKKNPKWRFDARYYSYKLPIDNTGYAVEIFAVDTTDGSLGGGAQYHWLENKLHESDARWKFIFGHYPVMGSGRHKRVGQVGSLPRLMTKYGAQAYFYGHDHIVEVSNDHGQIHGLSGGMGRGGMMLRHLGGATRRFTLTGPSEYDKDRQNWGAWGFHICQLSPNVMTCSIYAQSDNLAYQYAVTHDWSKKTKPMDGSASEIASDAATKWPTGRQIKAALKAEVDLPVGDETKDAVKIKKDEKGHVEDVSKAPTKPPTTTPEGQTTTAGPSTTAFKATLNKAMLETHPPHLASLFHPAVFSVSTECEGCRATHPVANQPFTITIQDIDVFSGGDSPPKIYLSSSPTGCHDTEDEKRAILPGTSIQDMKKNSKVFTTTIGRAGSVYVCFNDGRGLGVGDTNAFLNLKRINDPGEPTGFYLESPVGTPAAPPGQSPGLSLPANVPATAMPGLLTLAPDATSPPKSADSSGHTTLELILVATLCLGGGFGFAMYKNTQNSQGSRSQVPRDESQ